MSWAPDYATPAELKAWVTPPIDDNVDDTAIGLALTAASRAVDRATGRQFGLVDEPEARTFTPRLDRRRHRFRPRWVLDIDDLMTTTGLIVAGTAFDAVLHKLQPGNAAQVSRPWTQLVLDARSGVRLYGDDDEVTVTARWGWTTVPDTVKQAVLLQASRVFSRRKSPFGVAGSPDLGNELRLLAKLDPDVEVMLADYRRDWEVA